MGRDYYLEHVRRIGGIVHPSPKSVLAIVLFTVGLVWVSSAPVQAHHVRSFDACVGGRGGSCLDRKDYLAGDHPHLFAEIRPRYPDLRADVWAKEPHRAWAKVDDVRISDEGHITWAWDTTLADVHPHKPWRFQFKLPGHGRSDIVRIRVFRPDV